MLLYASTSPHFKDNARVGHIPALKPICQQILWLKGSWSLCFLKSPTSAVFGWWLHINCPKVVDQKLPKHSNIKIKMPAEGRVSVNADTVINHYLWVYFEAKDLNKTHVTSHFTSTDDFMCYMRQHAGWIPMSRIFTVYIGNNSRHEFTSPHSAMLSQDVKWSLKYGQKTVFLINYTLKKQLSHFWKVFSGLKKRQIENIRSSIWSSSAAKGQHPAKRGPFNVKGPLPAVCFGCKTSPRPRDFKAFF